MSDVESRECSVLEMDEFMINYCPHFFMGECSLTHLDGDCPFYVKTDMDFIATLLRGIESELMRLYFNKYQKEMDSPFGNYGPSAVYENDTFKVSAYDWDVDGQVKPNFEYKVEEREFKLWWYKYLGRGMHALCVADADAEFLYQMYRDCIQSLKKDFGEVS